MIYTTLLDRIARHERATLLATIAGLTLACWAWIVPMGRDMYGAMSGPAAWMMTRTWDLPHLLLLFAMWTAMMVAMMLPSAAPLFLTYSTAARHRTGSLAVSHVYAMAAGYLLVWLGFSAGATLMQRELSTRLVLSPMMQITSPVLSGVLLTGAGLYQMTPLKRACIATCSSPLDFLMRRWREGAAGAFRLGLEHGLVCVACCWALMLLLFLGGVMNLAVIGAITAVVLVEKLTPFGARSARVTGVFLIAAGVWVLARQAESYFSAGNSPF